MAKKHIDATDHQIGQKGIVTLSGSGIAELERTPIEKVTDVNAGMKKAEVLAFMEEIVTVVVQTTPDKFAERVVQVAVNGRNQFFPRGEKVQCKRKYLAVLAGAKGDSFGNEQYKDEATGDMGYRYPKSTSLKYPFTVIHDPNPKGAEWVQNLLAEAA